VGGDVRDGAGGGVVVDDGALRVLLLSGLAEGVCDAAGRGCLAGEHGRVDVRQRGHGCSPGGGARAGEPGAEDSYAEIVILEIVLSDTVSGVAEMGVLSEREAGGLGRL
jgi:hypothetical protein